MSDVIRRLGKEEESLHSAQNKYSISKCFASSLCSRAFCLLILLLKSRFEGILLSRFFFLFSVSHYAL